MRVRRTSTRLLVASLATFALTAVLVAAPPFGPESRAGDAAPPPSAKGTGGGQKAVLKKYLEDTWKSFEAMAVPGTGLPADNIGGDLTAGSRSGFTSPTNMGAYLWSTVAARDTGLIGKREAFGGWRRPSTRSASSRSTSRAACSTTGTTRPPCEKLLHVPRLR